MSDNWLSQIPAELLPRVEAMRAEYAELVNGGCSYEESTAWAEKHAVIIDWLEAHGI